MNTQIIEENIYLLKEKRTQEHKNEQYNRIANNLKSYFTDAKIKRFDRGLILSFFDLKQYPTTTQRRHIKGIITALKNKGFITDDKRKKTAIVRRVETLTTTDYNSYIALMNKNGFRKVDFFKWECNKDGVPTRKKVDTKNLNENSDEDFDFSVLRQTKPRRQQGVFTFNTKSIRNEKRPYTVKCYKVV